MADSGFSTADQNHNKSLIAKSNAGDNTPVPLWADPSTHRLLVDIGTPSFTVANVGTTGAAVPGSAGYLGINVAGNLRGQTGVNPSGVVYAAQTDIASFGGTAVSLGQQTAANSIPVILPSATITTLTPPAAITNYALETGGNLATLAGAVSASKVNVNISSGNITGFALDTSVNGLLVSQGSTTSGQKGPLVQGAVTTSAPSYVTAQTSPLSLTTAGGLRSDLASVGGTAITLGQTTMASSIPVVLPSNQAAIPVNATLQTQTDTVMVGGVNIKEINAVTPLMGNGTTGTGSMRVTLASDSTGIANYGHGATGSSVPAGATYAGIRGSTALPSAVSDGQLVGAFGDKYGRHVALVSTIRDLVLTQTTTISNSTSETTIGTAVASVFLDLIMLIISNTSTGTNSRLDFRDTTGGSVLFSLQSNGGQPPIGFALPTPIPQTSVNTNWTCQAATAVTDLRVYLVAAKNK